MSAQPDTRPRAVVTLAVGTGFEAMTASTHPLMRAYAQRIGADFVVIDEPRHTEALGLATFEKFQLYELLDRYSRILFLDADVIVAPDAPDVFEVVPPEVFGAVSEEGYFDVPVHKRLTQEVLGVVDWRRPYFNSGVMVLGSIHRVLFDPSDPILHTWVDGERHGEHSLSDQPYLNYRVNQLDLAMVDLGHPFNHTRAMGYCHFRFRSHFIHYAGPSGHRYGTKLSQLQRDVNIMKRPLHREAARRWPRIRWVMDRIHPAFIRYLMSKVKVTDAT